MTSNEEDRDKMEDDLMIEGLAKLGITIDPDASDEEKSDQLYKQIMGDDEELC